MKKIFRFAMLVMLGAAIAVACEDKPETKPVDNDKEQEGDKDKEKDTDAKALPIAIDGEFADWDAITAEVAKANDFADVWTVPADETDPAITVLKCSSDGENVYFYAEIKVEALPQNNICKEWGDSYKGCLFNNGKEGYGGEKGDADNDDIGDPNFNLFFDPDGNADTGFYTYAADEDTPAIPGLGCEMCAQNIFFMCGDKFSIAWNQTNIGPTKYLVDGNEADYDYNGTFFQEADWNASGTVLQYGWQNCNNDGAGDNVAPTPDNIKAVVANGIAKVEFAIEKGELVNLSDEDTNYAWGVCYRFGDYEQDCGPLKADYATEE